MEIQVLFYGVLADVAGTGFKTYNGITSMPDLMIRILNDYPSMLHYNYRVCHNNTVISGDPVLSDGDRVAFLPPFEGG